MTQQPYPPQYPQAPQQAYPPPPYPPQGYPQVQQPYPPPYPQQQAYPAPPPQQPAQQPTQPLAQGSLDDYYNQPSAAAGPSISWSNADRTPKPIGTAYAGIVARDVTNADVQQQTDFNTKAPMFYRDGRPKFAMRVPLKVQPSQEFPEGEATWYVKGQARDELVRAMAEAGASGAPQGGAGIRVTLVGRRNSEAGLNPANVVQVQYSPPPGHQPAQQQVPQQIPLQTQPSTDAPPPAPVQAPVQQWAPPSAPVQPPIQQQVPPPAPVQPPIQQQQVQPSAPSGLSPEQQALLARLTGS